MPLDLVSPVLFVFLLLAMLVTWFFEKYPQYRYLKEHIERTVVSNFAAFFIMAVTYTLLSQVTPHVYRILCSIFAGAMSHIAWSVVTYKKQ